MHEADAIGFGGGKALGRKQVAPALPLADGGHQVGRDDGGEDAELDLGQGELRVVGCQCDVAGGDQPDSAAEGRPMHTGNRRFRQFVERAHQSRERMRVVQVLLRVVGDRPLHPVEIGAGTKTLAGGGEDDHAHGRIGVQREERVREFVDQLLVKGVVPLFLVQRDNPDGIVDLGHDRLVRLVHGRSPPGVVMRVLDWRSKFIASCTYINQWTAHLALPCVASAKEILDDTR